MLSESMIGKIAAGEVVERPASAIKELIENSLDAGATAITAEIRDGGLSYIRVTDNGSGIDESDIRMAFERHATSKISREQDLSSIATLGFRGEALASIAAVSHVSLITRTAQRDTGLKVINEGGKITSIEETACPVGTTITVTDLFFNTPVRKGFMKKASAEASAVSDLIVQLILSRPDVSFRFLSNGKVQYHSPGDGQLSSAVHTIWGGQVLKTMRPVKGNLNGVLLSGYVGVGENARGNRGQEFFFINGRMMHSGILSSALETACRERVMIGRFPICTLHLHIAYEAVDVNVHPNKLEVRFRDEAGVSEAVTTLVLEALQDRDAFERPVAMELEKPQAVMREQTAAPAVQASPVRGNMVKPTAEVTVSKMLPPSAQVPESTKPEPVFKEAARPSEEYAARNSTTVPREPADPVSVSLGRRYAADSAPVIPALSPEVQVRKPEEKAEQVSTILPEIRKPLKILGALFNTYILIEYEDTLLMVDQHAVHERLLFDRLMQEHQGQNIGQELLVPYVISLTKKEIGLIEDNRKELESIGLVIESFGEKDAAVRTIPVVLGEAETAGFVRDILTDLEAGRGLTFEKKRAELLQTACKHAVKGGEALSEDQLRSLVTEMIEKKVTPTCPHGRPLVVAISRRELDKKFKRIQG